MKKLLALSVLAIITACNGSFNPKVVNQELVFLSSRGNGFDLYKTDQNGGNLVQLTTQPGWDWGPRWWPGQSGILHYAQDTSGNFSHRLISAAGESMEMDFQGLKDFIASPSGKYALYTDKVNGKDHVFMQDLEKGTAKDITPRDAYHGRPKWSPDGKLILMISDISGAQELHLYSLRDQSIVQLTEGVGRAKYASWAPTSRMIAFTREVLEEPKKDHDIFILDLKSKKVTQFTDTPYGEQEISWSPMGDKIAYHGTIDGKDDIYTIELRTKKVKKITNGEGYHGEPAWIPIYQ